MTTESIRPVEDEELSVKELILSMKAWIRYIWSKWRIILIAGVIGALVGLAYSLWEKPLYTATTTFVLESSGSKNGLGRLAGMATVIGIDFGGEAGNLFQGGNLLELYKSRTMLANTLLTEVHPDSDQLLIERYIEFRRIKEDWKGKSELLALDFRKDSSALDPETTRLRNGVITSFVNTIRKEILTVEELDKNSSIIKVEVTSQDEVFSKAFNERLVREVNEFYKQTKTQKSTNNVAILEAKVDSVRAVMSRAIYTAANVSDATPNLNPTRQVQRIVPAQEAQFSVEANKAILSQLLQNLELTKMALLQEQPLIQLVDQPVYPLKVERIGELKGLLIGGFLFSFLAILILVLREFYRITMLSEEN